LNLRAPALVAALSLVPFAQAQSVPATVYAESFRQGPTQIVEQKFEIKLSPHDPTFAARIKDSHGSDRYALSIDPQGPEGDAQITSWQVKLVDLQHRYYDNILLTSRQPEPSAADPKNNLWRLDPSNFARVPATTLRIIKVDGFYLALHMTAHHFTPIDSPYLDSMTVTIELTNTDPRTVENVPK
jgi:hypothetical protein